MDISIFQFINGFAGRWWPLDWLGIFLANYAPFFLILLAIYFFFKEKSRQGRIYFFSFSVLSAILSRGVITETIRFFYDKPRPFETLQIKTLINHSAGGSFPSGHAALFFALFLAIYFLARRNDWSMNPIWWSLGIVLAMGAARVFAGVHWPIDILTGAAIGLLSAFIVKKVLPEPKITEPRSRE